MKQLDQFIQDSGGIVSVSELAGFLELDEGAVRSWARGHGLRRIGATFAFNDKSARELAMELLADEEDEDDLDEDDLDDEDEDDDEFEDDLDEDDDEEED